MVGVSRGGRCRDLLQSPPDVLGSYPPGSELLPWLSPLYQGQPDISWSSAICTTARSEKFAFISLCKLSGSGASKNWVWQPRSLWFSKYIACLAVKSFLLVPVLLTFPAPLLGHSCAGKWSSQSGLRLWNVGNLSQCILSPGDTESVERIFSRTTRGFIRR